MKSKKTLYIIIVILFIIAVVLLINTLRLNNIIKAYKNNIQANANPIYGIWSSKKEATDLFSRYKWAKTNSGILEEVLEINDDNSVFYYLLVDNNIIHGQKGTLSNNLIIWSYYYFVPTETWTELVTKETQNIQMTSQLSLNLMYKNNSSGVQSSLFKDSTRTEKINVSDSTTSIGIKGTPVLAIKDNKGNTILSNKDFSYVYYYPFRDDNNIPQDTLVIAIPDSSSEIFEDFTSSHINQTINVYYNDQLICSPTITHGIITNEIKLYIDKNKAIEIVSALK